jgi:hypothetical protein
VVGPALVLVLSLAALVILLLGGADPLGLAPLLAGLGVLVAVLVLAVQGVRGARARARARDLARRLVLVDGSNVLHWREGTPDLQTVGAVLRRLEAEALEPVVVFDANAGYKVEGRWMGEAEMSRRLGLPRDRVIVAHKGTPADPILLDLAARTGAVIVSKDRFRDWAEEWPLVLEPGRLRRGGWRNGALVLAPGAAVGRVADRATADSVV